MKKFLEEMALVAKFFIEGKSMSLKVVAVVVWSFPAVLFYELLQGPPAWWHMPTVAVCYVVIGAITQYMSELSGRPIAVIAFFFMAAPILVHRI